MWRGSADASSTRRAILCAKTLVFPEPGPARMHKGAASDSTATRCWLSSCSIFSLVSTYWTLSVPGRYRIVVRIWIPSTYVGE